MNNIIIIGGGTAGWLTALFAKKYYKNSNVKLIESSEIGILGAGEGSTPNLVNFLSELEIDESDLLKKVNGTKKIGIHFHNCIPTCFEWGEPLHHRCIHRTICHTLSI